MNHRGSSSSAKLWRHHHLVAHLSTNFEQTLRRHDGGQAADCFLSLKGRSMLRFQVKAIHTSMKRDLEQYETVLEKYADTRKGLGVR